MRLQDACRLALAAVASLAISACGSSSSNAPGRINVRLVDGPSTQYKKIMLNVQRVELNTDAGWQVLSTPNATYDLLGLTNGVHATLVDGQAIAAGHYTQMRLVLGTGNKVVFADDTSEDLVVPSGLQSGIKITTSFDVAPNTTADLFIDIDGEHSVFVHETGSGKYMLRPTVRAYERVMTGSILGTVTAGGVPLAGAKVYAETLDASGNPTVVTHATTGVDGKYVLGLLPVGGTFYVVGQPVVGTVAYAARASGPIQVTASAPTPTYDATFDVTTSVGGLSGKITPTAVLGQGDVVSIATMVDSAGTPRNFVVRDPTATVSGDESYEALLLPAGTYSAWVTRSTTDASNNTTVASGPVTSNIAVAASATTTMDLTAP